MRSYAYNNYYCTVCACVNCVNSHLVKPIEAKRVNFFHCDFPLQNGSVQWKSRQNGSIQWKCAMKQLRPR